MRAAVVVPIVLRLIDPTNLVVDLFAPDDTPLSSLGKQPHIDNSDVTRQDAGMTEEE